MARLRKYVGKNAVLTVGNEIEYRGHLKAYDSFGNPETFGKGWRLRYWPRYRGNDLHYRFVTSDDQEISVHSRGKNRVRALSHVSDTPTIRFHIPHYHGALPTVA